MATSEHTSAAPAEKNQWRVTSATVPVIWSLYLSQPEKNINVLRGYHYTFGDMDSKLRNKSGDDISDIRAGVGCL